MELAQLIDALQDPAAYPGRVDAVEVRQTHISVVFLAGEHVYKIKKPVKFGFVDFSTLEKREHYCREEVRLNARLAAEVYLGVVGVAAAGGRLRVVWLVTCNIGANAPSGHRKTNRSTPTCTPLACKPYERSA